MAKRRTVAELMTPDVITARPDDSVAAARTLIGDNRIGALPIVDELKQALGIVSVNDLAAEGLDPGTRLDEIMSKPVRTVSILDSAGAAARVMRQFRIHHVLVMQRSSLVGILSTFDLLAVLEAMDDPEDRQSTMPR